MCERTHHDYNEGLPENLLLSACLLGEETEAFAPLLFLLSFVCCLSISSQSIHPKKKNKKKIWISVRQQRRQFSRKNYEPSREICYLTVVLWVNFLVWLGNMSPWQKGAKGLSCLYVLRSMILELSGTCQSTFKWWEKGSSPKSDTSTFSPMGFSDHKYGISKRHESWALDIAIEFRVLRWLDLQHGWPRWRCQPWKSVPTTEQSRRLQNCSQLRQCNK